MKTNTIIQEDRKYKHNLIERYRPYKGFVDLREWDLPKSVFKKFEDIQYQLSYMAKEPDYYKKYLPAQWQKAQELSGSLQIELQKYDRLRQDTLL